MGPSPFNLISCFGHEGVDLSIDKHAYAFAVDCESLSDLLWNKGLTGVIEVHSLHLWSEWARFTDSETSLEENQPQEY